MLALVFSFLVFAYWTLLGRAIIALAYPRVGVLRSWLLAPALGLCAVLLGLMVFNQAGLPIRAFATALSLALGIGAAGVLWRSRRTPFGRGTGPFLAAVAVGLLWAGWPAFQTGFNWVSYANDDMANYCLAAQRFLNHGFYDVPTAPELAGRDYSVYYFFMHVADMMRFGSEHLVAWTAALLHQQPTRTFMPTILALELVQISAAGALVLQRGRDRRRALVTVWLLAVSPLFMLGTLYQLIAQVGGVALLLATLALLFRPWVTPRRPVLLRYAILPAVTSAALCIFYPEVTPFAGLAFIGFALLWAVRHRAFPSALVALAAYTLVLILVLLRQNLISYVSILVVQFNGAMQSTNMLLSLFPYFMIPTGFSNLFGWMPIAHDFPEPVISLTIIAGMFGVLAIVARSVREAWRLTPTAVLLLIEFVLALRLFAGTNDFGLYKLAMWMQPVLLAGLAGWMLWWSGRRTRVLVVSVAAYALTAAPSALYYTNSSRGLQSGGLTELRLASELGLQIHAPADPNAQLTSTIENVVAAKFAASELRGHPLSLVSRDFFAPTTRTDFKDPPWPVRLQPHYAEMAQAKPLIHDHYRHLVSESVIWGTSFIQPAETAPTQDYVSVQPQLSLFNKFSVDPAAKPHGGVFVVEPAATVRNRLVFVHSGLGNHYYLGERNKISFFQQESDPFEPGYFFNGIGRFMLLRVENPTDRIYLRISATRSLLTGRTAWNPRALVHAAMDRPLGVVGNGAFNLFVGPLTPREFQGAHYVAIDYQEAPMQLLDQRTGLKRLYNRMVLLDYRKLLGWARDISAVSEAEYAALARPRSISRFPDDLALAHDLEFSGAYEDSWLSPHAFFVLDRAVPGDVLRLRGLVPEIKGTALGTGRAKVTVNGVEICEVPAPLGTFDWLLPVPNPGPKTTIDVTFTVSTPLPGLDQRVVAGKLSFLRFERVGPTIGCNYSDAAGPRLAATGVDQDGWVRQHATVLLPAHDQPTDVRVRVEYPPWSAAPSATLHARIAGTDLAGAVTLDRGHRPELRLRLPAASKPYQLELEGPPEFALPSPDTRQRSYRISALELSRSSAP